MPTNNYKYQFEKPSMPKGDCPNCNHRKVFRYYDGLPREFGKCERLNNCGYHNKPSSDVQPSEVPKVEPKPQLYVDANKVETWLNDQSSNFHKYAMGLGITPEHLKAWGIGSTPKGETVFVFRNAKDELWNAKFFQYTEGGSRSKETDAYSLKQTKEGRYLLCLFGEQNLSSGAGRIVCIVESEKTAVIASFFYPQYDWVSCGSNQGLTEDKTGVLVGRKVWNIRDADIAGRSTCSLKKLQDCKTPLKCAGCKIPAIEKRLQQWNIKFTGLDAFQDKEDGYDLADAIRDAVIPDLAAVELHMITMAIDEAQAETIKAIEGEKKTDKTYYGEGDNTEWAWKIPYGVNLDEVEEYGFYEYGNKYYMRRVVKEIISYVEISNFTMEVLFLIQGMNAKRIVRIKNTKKKTVTLEFAIDELISLDKFKLKIESNGNFLFKGSASDIMRIKQKLFEFEKASAEVSYAGHHRDQFYTFANGVFNYTTNQFISLNEHKMVDLEGRHYLIPLLESDGDEDENANFKAFQHKPSNYDFKTWANLFVGVYGDNGKIGLAFSIMAIFLDIVKEATVGKYPMLFLFGQRGSGKTTMAKSLGCLFGERKEPPKLEGKSTPKSYVRQLAQLSNSILVFDEFKNSIHPDLIGMLKGIHDGSGYTRSKMDNTNKTVSTSVRSTTIVGGQEMPNSEAALFSRFLLLEFQPIKNAPQKQLDDYDKLIAMEDESITSVLLEILKHRAHFQEHFTTNYRQIRALLRKAYAESETIDRQILIGAAIIAAAKTAQSVLDMPFTWESVQSLVEVAITRQTVLMNTADEVQHFFETIGLMLRQGQIRDELDIKFKDLAFLQQGEDNVQYTGGWLLIRMKNVYPVYRERLIRQNMKPLDSGTLERYLKGSSAFDLKATTASHRFKSLPHPTNALCFLQKRVVEVYKIDLTEYTKNVLQTIDNQ